MPSNPKHTNSCPYIGRKGRCGRPCFRDTCSIHVGKKSLTLCRSCGVAGTSTPHGYCATVKTGCLWKAQHASRVLKKENDLWEAYIEDIISWDWQGYLNARTHLTEPAPA